jgi:hypothetical protein
MLEFIDRVDKKYVNCIVACDSFMADYCKILWRIDPFRRKQRVQQLLCNKQINKRPFLSNCSINTFPRKLYPGYY